jgi:formylglycine-generating enzyme required for sulfatase activity
MEIERITVFPELKFPQWLPAGSASMIENEKDGSQLLLVPGGTFLAGGPKEDEGGEELFPADLPPYYLGLHPVTNRQYLRFEACPLCPLIVDGRGLNPRRDSTWGNSTR